MAHLIYAHRGASADFPEMSVAAYREAISQGADGFECDLRLTKDHVIVCWHDTDLQRIASSPGVISQLTLSQLLAIYPVLTFEELLDLAIAHKKHLALETKHPVPTGLLIEKKLLEYLEMRRPDIEVAGINIAIMSFSWRAIRRCRKQRWETVFLSAHKALLAFNPGSAFGPSIATLRTLKITGRTSRQFPKLFVWTVNEAKDAQLCVEKCVDVIITDKPGYIRSILQNE
jgi:glycerophosphoryl diester phosphodiesterase